MHNILHIYGTMRLLGITLASSMQQGYLQVYFTLMALNTVQVQCLVVYYICKLLLPKGSPFDKQTCLVYVRQSKIYKWASGRKELRLQTTVRSE